MLRSRGRIGTSKINNPCSSIVNQARPGLSNTGGIDDCRAIEALIGEVPNRWRMHAMTVTLVPKIGTKLEVHEMNLNAVVELQKRAAGDE